MAKKKEIPLTRGERSWEAIKRSLITTLAVILGTVGLEYLGMNLSEGSIMAISTLIVTSVWKYFRTASYTKKA